MLWDGVARLYVAVSAVAILVTVRFEEHVAYMAQSPEIGLLLKM